MILLLAAAAQASTFAAPYTLEDLCEQSQSVVRGPVVALDTEVIDGLPWTVATIQVDEALQGPDQDTVQVRWPGGPLDDEVELIVSGTPTVTLGEDVVVFVDPAEQAVGLAQGVWHLQGDTLLRDPADLVFHEPSELPETRTLDEVRQAVVLD